MTTVNERRICEYLTEAGITFTTQHTIPALFVKRVLRFDICLPEVMEGCPILIEFQETLNHAMVSPFCQSNMRCEERYEDTYNTWLYDSFKNHYCKFHNVPLIHIPQGLSRNTEKAFLFEQIEHWKEVMLIQRPAQFQILREHDRLLSENNKRLMNVKRKYCGERGESDLCNRLGLQLKQLTDKITKQKEEINKKKLKIFEIVYDF